MDEYPGSQTLADRACEFFPVDLTLEFWLDACLLFADDPEHLKMNLTQPDGDQTDRVFFEAVWFHAAEREESLKAATTGVSLWAAVPEINRFRGRATATLRVKDRKNFPPLH